MIKKLYRKLLLSLMQSNFWHWLLLKVIPPLRLTYKYPKINGWQYMQAHSIMAPGDIILCVDKKKLTSLLVPGEFTHAALCVGYGNKFWPGYEIAEMLGEGYTKSFLFDVCKESDRIVVLRAPAWSPEYRRSVIDKCLSLEGTPYDVGFDLGIKALYCSELVYQSDFDHTLDLDLSDIHSLGTKYISPDGIFKCKNLSVVYDSDKGLKVY